MSYTPVGAGGGGGLVLVDEITVAGGAVGRIEFQNLDGDNDGVYELWWWLERAAAVDKIQFQPNGLNTNQTTVWTSVFGTPATENALNEFARWVHGTGLQRPRAWGRAQFWARSGTFRAFQAETGEGDLAAGGNYDRWYAQGMWRDNAANLTDLDILTLDAANVLVNGWGNNSRLQLWKRPF